MGPPNLALWAPNLNYRSVPRNYVSFRRVISVEKPSWTPFPIWACPADTDVLKRSRCLTTKPDVVKTSGKRRLICNILKTFYLRCLEDVQFTTSWRRLIYDVLRTSDLRRLEDVQFTTSWRRLIYDVLRTSDLRRLEDVWFTSSWGRPDYDVFKTSDLQRFITMRVTMNFL